MFGLGLPEFLLLGGIVVLFFGAKRLPQLGSSLGKSIRSFRKGLKEDEREVHEIGSDNNTETPKKD